MPQIKIHDTPTDRVRAWRRDKKLQEIGPLQALFPYPGGKSQVAPVIWQRFGTVRHYLEPFAGSLAVLLARPHRPRVETINDTDGHLVNVYRSLATDPATVAHIASRPVSSVELWARHDYLCSQRDALTARMIADHRYYDAELAGLWMYAVSTWAGSGLGRPGRQRPMPHVAHTGHGIHALQRRGTLPQLCNDLQTRLLGVRLLCNDWQDCLSDAVVYGVGQPVGILLDPPYGGQTKRDQTFYATAAVCAPAVRDWAIAHGEDARLRMALCGLDGEHQMPEGWCAHRWQARGGFANTGRHGRGHGQPRQETIWFSPHCLQPAGGQRLLFGEDEAAG